MSLSNIPQKILNIFSNHIAEQEAEIQRLESIVLEYRKKFGIIDLNSSPEFQKARLERNLQKIREETTNLKLELNSNQTQINTKEKMVSDLKTALKKLEGKSVNSSEKVSDIEKKVSKLEELNQKLDEGIREIEENLQQLIKARRRI